MFPLTGAIGVWPEKNVQISFFLQNFFVKSVFQIYIPASLPLTKVSFKSTNGFRRGVVRECLGGIFAVLALVGVDTTS